MNFRAAAMPSRHPAFGRPGEERRGSVNAVGAPPAAEVIGMTTPAEMLTAVGVALYGEEWVKPLARALGEHENQLRRWRDNGGKLAADDEIFAAALALLSERQLALNDAADKLERWLAHQ